MNEIHYRHLDDWVMSAYNHVKTTGNKVSYFANKEKVRMEFHSSDGSKFVIRLSDLIYRSLKNKFYNYVESSHQTELVQIINRQLLAFI